MSSLSALRSKVSSCDLPGNVAKYIQKLEDQLESSKTQIVTFQAVIADQYDQLATKQKQIGEQQKQIRELKKKISTTPIIRSRSSSHSHHSRNRATAVVDRSKLSKQSKQTSEATITRRKDEKPRPHIISKAPHKSTMSARAVAIDLPPSQISSGPKVCNEFVICYSMICVVDSD